MISVFLAVPLKLQNLQDDDLLTILSAETILDLYSYNIFFREHIYIYKGDGDTKNNKLINSEHGSFVFIRSADLQAGGNDRKKRGEMNIN